ncbi:tetratricopeptide repeat protein [Dyella lipolytica]|uniref:Tetratricopeptide repeat protein n=2 Tax=Dyella lipolytica TaxID=1867835 RepID=A0ABW8IQU8_9GAMM
MQNRFTAMPLFLLLLLAFVFAAYWPGLHGGFLFDDFANLPILGDTGPIDNWPAFWRYITAGTADPIGRPLTLLSFLLDAHNWPADPLPFKRTNLILHLLNGALLTWLLRRLGHMLFLDTDRRRIDMAALLGASLWLVHPLFVSTTLYIVQREAILPATFTLLGLLSWLHGRTALLHGRTLSGLAWTTVGLGVCTLLGVLSKANGILLPVLALVIEYTLLRSVPQDPLSKGKNSGVYHRAMLALAWLPASIVAGYLLQQGEHGLVHGIPSIRPWTLGQRLLTEPRVLVDYLDLLWLPRPFTPGLFNDNIQVSTSLWSPYTTLPALLVVLGLIGCALKFRRQLPVLAAATLFYFVGQSIESSTIPLELYFEHRNYLPAMLMFWPLALWLCSVRQSRFTAAHTAAVFASIAPSIRHRAKLALAVVLLLGLALMTHSSAELWGNTHDQALLWAELNPDSPRAQANAAVAERNAGHPEHAVVRLQHLLVKDPNQVQLALNLFNAECQVGSIDQATLTASRTALRTARDTGSLLVHWFERTMEQATNPPCPQLTFQTIADLLDAAQDNRYLADVPGRQQDLYYLQGRLALMQSNANVALADFNYALDLNVRAPIALEQAALLGSMGYQRQGLAHLDHYEAVRDRTVPPNIGMPQVHAWILQHQQYWPKEMAHLRTTLSEDASNPLLGGK